MAIKGPNWVAPSDKTARTSAGFFGVPKTDEEMLKRGFIPVWYSHPEYDDCFYSDECVGELNNIDDMERQEDGSYVQHFRVVDLPVEVAKENLKTRITAKRWERETSGIILNNQSILTGLDDQNRIASICLAVVSKQQRGEEVEPIQFKTASGWVTLDAAALLAIGDAVTAHVEHCFNNEKRLHDLCDGAETVADLVAIDIESGWDLPEETTEETVNTESEVTE